MTSRAFCHVLALLVAVVACAPPAKMPVAATQADSAAINAIREQAVTAVNSGDTTFAYMADDIVLMPPNGPTVTGIAAVRSWFNEGSQQFRLSAAYTSGTMVFFGDWAIGRTAGTLTLTPGGWWAADQRCFQRDACVSPRRRRYLEAGAGHLEQRPAGGTSAVTGAAYNEVTRMASTGARSGRAGGV